MTKAETLAKEKENQQDDFQKELSINKYKLDEECLSHSGRFAYYAEACAVAKTNVSKANDNLKLVTAEANLRIRKNYAENGQKFTEAVIASELEIDKQVLKARDELREAEEIYGRLQVAVNAMDARRSELDNLVKLYVAGYFSTVDGNKKSVNEQTSNDIRKNLNK
jgi:hypothetical protein